MKDKWISFSLPAQMRCPACDGTGQLEMPQDEILNEIFLKHEAIKCLYVNSYGIRQIMRLFHYKSPQSISKLITKEVRIYKRKLIKSKGLTNETT
jgi:hypothetical protein